MHAKQRGPERAGSPCLADGEPLPTTATFGQAVPAGAYFAGRSPRNYFLVPPFSDQAAGHGPALAKGAPRWLSNTYLPALLRSR